MVRIDVPLSSRPRSGRGVRYLFIFLLLLIVGAALWTWLTLDWAYADGTRAGVLQRFTHRGWLCKTQEGELAQYVVAGVSPRFWQFSVRDPAVAAQLEKVVGEQVQLHYTEHPGVPSTCFADTRFFVDRVTVMETPPSGTSLQIPPTPPAAGAAPAPPPRTEPKP